MIEGPAERSFFGVLAAAYMYVVTVLAWLMYRFPREKAYPMLLANAKFASSALSCSSLFAVHAHWLVLSRERDRRRGTGPRRADDGGPGEGRPVSFRLRLAQLSARPPSKADARGARAADGPGLRHGPALPRRPVPRGDAPPLRRVLTGDGRAGPLRPCRPGGGPPAPVRRGPSPGPGLGRGARRLHARDVMAAARVLYRGLDIDLEGGPAAISSSGAVRSASNIRPRSAD